MSRGEEKGERQAARTIRPARPGEAALLHALTERSTLHWGYEPAFLAFEPEALAVDEAFLAAHDVHVLEEGGRVVGYHALKGAPPELQLDKCFVEPDRIGTGCGRLLWEHAVARASERGATALFFWADPHAAPFYRAMGAVWQREEPTDWPGFVLQVFRFPLPAAAAAPENGAPGTA